MIEQKTTQQILNEDAKTFNSYLNIRYKLWISKESYDKERKKIVKEWEKFKDEWRAQEMKSFCTSEDCDNPFCIQIKKFNLLITGVIYLSRFWLPFNSEGLLFNNDSKSSSAN